MHAVRDAGGSGSGLPKLIFKKVRLNWGMLKYKSMGNDEIEILHPPLRSNGHFMALYLLI